MTAAASSLAARQSYATVFKRAALWLIFLAPFFYLTYGLANWYASTRSGVGSIIFSWERSVPFLAWSILPYWSINLFYALSLFLNDGTPGVDRLAGRYLTAQVVACACFVAFPLAASFVRPDTDGLPGFMFDALTGFDKPFNQAPSLHIALLVIIWDHLRRRMPAALRAIWHVWCFLIGASVMTTFQHHFIDIPTGALLGLFALWLFPAEGDLPAAGFTLTVDQKRRKLGGYYLAGAILLLAITWVATPADAAWLVLLWPALSLAIVAFAYFGGGPKVFQKQSDGNVSLASRFLLWPYRIGAGINARAWTRKLPPSVEIANGVHLGRFPTRDEANQFTTVVDLCAEFERPAGTTARWMSVPMLDLATPEPADAARAAALIQERQKDGTLLVCCALGFQRSATALAEWLIASGRANDWTAAETLLRRAGRPVHLKRMAPKEDFAP